MSEIAVAYAIRRPLLEALALRLDQATREALDGVLHIDRICFRVKDQRSFMTKALQPQFVSPLMEMEDQVAGCIFLFSRVDTLTE